MINVGKWLTRWLACLASWLLWHISVQLAAGNLKVFYVTVCSNLHKLIAFLLALCERLVTWREVWDSLRLSWCPIQVCGRCVWAV